MQPPWKVIEYMYMKEGCLFVLFLFICIDEIHQNRDV
jgi:hypothetical protein